jgi:hypothetical protein
VLLEESKESFVPMRMDIAMDIASSMVPTQESKISLPSSFTTLKPKTFDELLMAQISTTGSWTNIDVVLSFFKNPEEAFNHSSRMPQSDSAKEVEIWLTILALYILQKKFGSKEDEWQLIAGKARGFLKANGIPKPETIVKALRLTFN